MVRLLRSANTFFSTKYHRIELLDPPRLPPTGPAILVCNHTSGLDPFLIQAVCPRLITWMMAKEFYDLPAFTWALKLIGAIPVARSGRDSLATRAAIRALHDGQVLGIFPEGRIERGPVPELLPFQSGVAMMAIKTDVPVYPAYLDGTQRNKPMVQAFMEANEATLTFGPAVQFDRSSTDKRAFAAASDAIQSAVQGLMDKSLRR